jgi:hypothetical protein
MPLVHLIFFEDPRELTDEQVEEARIAGHLREDAPEEPPVDTAPRAASPAPASQIPDAPAVVAPPPEPPAEPEPEPEPAPTVPDRGTLTPP